MDQNVLVSSGHALLSALDKSAVPPRFAMWVHNTESDSWKLWIVPHPSMKDKFAFYRRVSEMISKNRAAFGGMDASDTEMIEAAHPAVKGLRRIVKAPGLNSISFSGNRFDGFYLPDGIILRSDL